MGKPILYQIPLSPPVRSVIMVAKAIGVDLELKTLDLLSGEHLKPEFLALNPHHTIPTLVDNDHIVWDSQAIIIYLVEKYGGKDQTIYPNDPATRSLIHQRLFFNVGIIFPALRASSTSIIFDGKPSINAQQLEAMRKAYEQLNALFRGNQFLVGDQITLADYALITNITQMSVFLDVDDVAFPNIRPWVERVGALIPDFETNTQYVDQYRQLVTAKMAENAK